MTEECRLLTKEELDFYKESIETLKAKLVEAKPELKEWVEKNFGRLK